MNIINRILFYIRRKLRRCYQCNTKVHDMIHNPITGLIESTSNCGIAHILDHGWGYVCIPCMIEEFKYRFYSNPK